MIMTNFVHNSHRRFEEEEEPSPSLSMRAEADNFGDGPLLAKKREKDLEEIRREMQASMSRAATWRSERKERCWNPGASTTNATTTSSNANLGDDEKKSEKGHSFIPSTWSVYTVASLLLCIGFFNLLLNLVIIVVLRISQGMEALQVVPAERLLKFYGNTDLDHVALRKGTCEGFGDEPIEVVGDSADIHVQVSNHHYKAPPSQLKVLRNGTLDSKVESFQVRDSRTGRPIFSTDSPEFALHPRADIDKIDVRVARTHRVAAPKNVDLNIKSDNAISVHGAEGTLLDSKDISWTAANGEILLHSRNGDLVIDAKDSIRMPNVSILQALELDQIDQIQKAYKVCICMPQGKIFLVPTYKTNPNKINCAKILHDVDVNYCKT